jgi:hypothetical protein
MLPPQDRETASPSAEEPKHKKNGFHFRRRNKGHEQVPADEPMADPPTAAAGFGAQDNRGVRPMPRYLEYSMFDWLVQSNLLFGLGYNVSRFSRCGRFEDANPGLRIEADADGLALGITVSRLHSFGKHIVGIVKPLVKVHAVSLSTGYYIRSRNLPAVAPVTTRPCSLVDATASPTWNQELILNAYFSDVVSEDTLLLFEVLDDKPSFRTDFTSSPDNAMPIAKRVAWGYLLPIGISGELNVGFSEDWKFSSRRALTRKSGGRAAGDGGVGSAHGSNDDMQGIPEGTQEDAQSADNRGSSSAASRSGSAKHPPAAEEGTGTPEGAAGGRRAGYPWHKPSVDKPVRVQLYAYRQFEGLLGYFQRKIKGWPAIAQYKDK